MIWLLALVLTVGLVVGAFFGADRAMQSVKKSRIQNIDYKDRWQGAVKLLEGEGRITQEEMRAIVAGNVPVFQKNAFDPPPQRPAIGLPDQRLLSAMESKDRCDLEILRARKGLPPHDSLEGMYPFHVREVYRARIVHETKGIDTETDE